MIFFLSFLNEQNWDTSAYIAVCYGNFKDCLQTVSWTADLVRQDLTLYCYQTCCTQLHQDFE